MTDSDPKKVESKLEVAASAPAKDVVHRQHHLMPPPAPKLWQVLTGRILSVVFIASGLLSMVGLANELEIRPRTEDAYVRANVIGIAAHVSGAIVELNVVDNQPVEEGQILFVVDPRPYEVALAQAEADLVLVDIEIAALEAAVESSRRDVKAAEARVNQAIADAAYAIQYYERIQPLLESRFVTPDQVVKAQTDAQALEAAVDRYRADVSAAVAMLQTSQANPQRTRR